MDKTTATLLAEWITYKPTLRDVLINWDRTTEILREHNIESTDLVRLIQESKGGSVDQASFGDHVLHKLAKMNLVVSRMPGKGINKEWFQRNLDATIGDLLQVTQYAAELRAEERSYIGCISKER